MSDISNTGTLSQEDLTVSAQVEPDLHDHTADEKPAPVEEIVVPEPPPEPDHLAEAVAAAEAEVAEVAGKAEAAVKASVPEAMQHIAAIAAEVMQAFRFLAATLPAAGQLNAHATAIRDRLESLAKLL